MEWQQQAERNPWKTEWWLQNHIAHEYQNEKQAFNKQMDKSLVACPILMGTLKTVCMRYLRRICEPHNYEQHH